LLKAQQKKSTTNKEPAFGHKKTTQVEETQVVCCVGHRGKSEFFHRKLLGNICSGDSERIRYLKIEN